MLERQRIERTDFTIRRRGYDPAEVDAHLAAIADQVEELRRSLRSSAGTSAAMASEQVRAIVEAAESRAGEHRRGAEEPVSAGARRERPPEDSQAKPAVLGRLEAMQNELATLIESLRTGGSVSAGLEVLETNLKEVRDAGTSRARLDPVAATPAAPSSRETMNGQRGGEVEPQLASEKAHGDALAPDLEGARLVALNMALNGSSREETERYLARNFNLTDRRALVDEVYASLEA